MTKGQVDEVEKQIAEAYRRGVMRGVGWMFAEACVSLDRKIDLRKVEIGKVVKAAGEHLFDEKGVEEKDRRSKLVLPDRVDFKVEK